MERERKFTALRAVKSVKARGTQKFRGKGANEVSNNMVKRTDSEARLPGLQSWFCHLLVCDFVQVM